MLRYFFFLISLISLSIQAQPKITLNFTDMDINVFINTISEITQKTFVVDPRVKAKITVISNTPLEPDQVYDTFLSLLSVHGFAAVPNGSVIKIVPESLAKSDNTPLASPTETLKGDALVTQVVKIKNISAPQLIPILRPLVNQQGHLVAYPSNNTLIVSDRANTVNRLLEIIQRIDQPNHDDEEIELVTLHHALASDVVRILNTLEQKNATTAAAEGKTSLSTLVADERTNSVLISGERSSRLQLRTLITHLDIPVKNVGNTQVIYLRYAQATNLANVLKGINDNLTKSSVQNSNQSALPEAIKTMIQADESTNSLVITANPEIMKNLQAVIRQLDVRRAQVLVEAIIAEISTDKARELGVQWLFYGEKGLSPFGISNFDNAGTKILDLATTAYQVNQNNARISPPNLGAGSFLGLGRFDHPVLSFAALLRALSADTQTNVLSTPSLLTLDNEEAQIIVGQNVPFVTGQYTNTGAVSGSTNPFQTIQREDVGLKLKVKPQINEGNAVKLQIEQEVSSISRSSVTTADIVTNKRSIKTTVIIEDGNMVVLGGLIDEDLQQTAQKVPGLGDLPILGSLFRSQSTKKVKRNLMVFLHPVIVRDSSTEVSVSAEKYTAMRNKQLDQQAQGLPLMSPQDIPVLPNLDNLLIILPGEQQPTTLPPFKGKISPLPSSER